MEHPLAKHPLTGGDEFSEEVEQDGVGGSSGGGMSGGGSGREGGTTDYSSPGKSVSGVAVANPVTPATTSRPKEVPLEFDGDDKLSTVRRSPNLFPELSVEQLGERFVQVKPPETGKHTRKTLSMDDPLRNQRGEDASSSNASAGDMFKKTIDFTGLSPVMADSPYLNSGVARSDVQVRYPPGEGASTSGIFVIRSNDPSDEPGNDPSGDIDDAKREIEVKRTIADFVWLEKRLRARYEGRLVPFLPDNMNILGRLRLGESYKEVRRFNFEKFLRRVLCHPGLGKTEEAKAFMGLLGTTQWLTIRSEAISSPGDFAIATSLGINKDQGGVQQILRWIGYRFWQVGRRIDEGLDFVLKKGREEDSLARDVTAKSLEQLKERFERLGETLVGVRRDLIRHTEIEEERRLEAARFQQTMKRLAEVETKENAALLELVAHAVNPFDGIPLGESLQCRSQTTPAEALLLEVLTEYVKMFNNVKSILSRRFTEREAYAHAVATYNSLRSQLEKRENANTNWGRTTTGVKEVNEDESELRQLVNKAATDLAEVRKHYQEVINVTINELQMYRQSLSDVLTTAFRNLAEERARHYRVHAEAWEAVASGVESLQSDFAQAALSGESEEETL